jgi:hypothetical protein
VPRRGKFPAIVAIALACVRAYPLARVHLCAPWCVFGPPHRACALYTQAHRRHRVCVEGEAGEAAVGKARGLPAWRVASTSKTMKRRPRQREDAANRFWGPPTGLALLLEECAECL